MPPRLRDVKETALYVDDMERALSFYRDVMGLQPMVSQERFCALNVGGNHVLLLFLRGGSLEGAELPGGYIPPHDGSGQLHVGFPANEEELVAWEAHLRARGVDVLSEVKWERGGRSIYFRDPDGHLLELLTPGVWPIY